MTPRWLPDHILAGLQSIAGEDNVRTEAASGPPDAEARVLTVYPPGAAELGAVIRWVRQAALPVFIQEPGAPGQPQRPVAFSARGGAADVGSTVRITISLERMKNIRHLDRRGLSLLVEPGATVDEIRREARRAGALCPAEPQAPASCLIGRCARCETDGCLADHIHGLEVILPTGDMITIGGGGTRDLDEYQLAYLLSKGETPPRVVTGIYLKLRPAL